MPRQLSRALFIRPLRNTDEDMLARLADIPAIHCPRRLYLRRLREQAPK